MSKTREQMIEEIKNDEELSNPNMRPFKLTFPKECENKFRIIITPDSDGNDLEIAIFNYQACDNDSFCRASKETKIKEFDEGIALEYNCYIEGAKSILTLFIITQAKRKRFYFNITHLEPHPHYKVTSIMNHDSGPGGGRD